MRKTVQELIQELQKFPPDSEILIGVQTNNYWNQVRTQSPRNPEYGYVQKSEYLRCDELIATDQTIENGELSKDWTEERLEKECRKIIII